MKLRLLGGQARLVGACFWNLALRLQRIVLSQSIKLIQVLVEIHLEVSYAFSAAHCSHWRAHLHCTFFHQLIWMIHYAWKFGGLKDFWWRLIISLLVSVQHIQVLLILLWWKHAILTEYIAGKLLQTLRFKFTAFISPYKALIVRLAPYWNDGFSDHGICLFRFLWFRKSVLYT